MTSNPTHSPFKVDPRLMTESPTNHALAPGGLQMLAKALLPLLGLKGKKLPAPLGFTPDQVNMSENRVRSLLGLNRGGI